MCLQGTDQSGQVQSSDSAPALAGNSDSPTEAKASSMSSGISPARSRAMYHASRASSSVTRAHADLSKGVTAIRTR